MVCCPITALQDFFFLWYGRSRSKARSLHENKLLSRKLQHGHRWSHANWQIINTKTQNTTTNRQDTDPPARFASHHPKDSKVLSRSLYRSHVLNTFFGPVLGAMMKQVCWHSRRSEAHRGLPEATDAKRNGTRTKRGSRGLESI